MIAALFALWLLLLVPAAILIGTFLRRQTKPLDPPWRAVEAECHAVAGLSEARYVALGLSFNRRNCDIGR